MEANKGDPTLSLHKLFKLIIDGPTSLTKNSPGIYGEFYSVINSSQRSCMGSLCPVIHNTKNSVGHTVVSLVPNHTISVAEHMSNEKNYIQYVTLEGQKMVSEGTIDCYSMTQRCRHGHSM